MPVTKIGVVYFADDPLKRVFRVVYPEHDDRELDGPVTDGERRPMLDDAGKPHAWTTFGVEPGRQAVLEKIDVADLPNWRRGPVTTPRGD